MRREDQDRINKFSRLHQRELLLVEEVNSKHVCDNGNQSQERLALKRAVLSQKDKEDLEEVANELELADEDDLIP